MAKLSQDDLLAQFEEMTLIELSEFVKAFEEKFDVTAAAAVAVAGPAVGGGEGAAQAEEQDEFDVILEGAGDKKIQVIKVVRELTSLGLKEAKGVASAAGFGVVSHDASDQDGEQWDADDWTVCFQTSAGQRDGGRPTLDLGVVRTGAPCPAADGERIPWPAMPAVTGMTFARAGEALKPIGFRKVEPESAYTDVALPGVADRWKICFQDPEPGEEIERPQFTTAYLKLAPPGAGCPERPYAELHPS